MEGGATHEMGRRAERAADTGHSGPADPLWSTCLPQRPQALSQQGWEVGINQVRAVGAPANTASRWMMRAVAGIGPHGAKESPCPGTRSGAAPPGSHWC